MPAVRIGQKQMLGLEVDVADFNLSLTRWQRMYDGKAADFLKEVALDFLSRVIEYTPVDTGRAASGWWSAGDALELGGVVEGRAEAGPRPDDTLQRLGRTEGAYEEHLSGPRKWIIISNQVPYILALEFGTSNQGGTFMVRRALAEIRSGLRAAWERLVGKGKRK